jgi:quinol monooxygenase YgiN
MIRTVLTLRVDPARLDDVLNMYREEDILQFSLDHSEALTSELSVAADGSGEIIVTAMWPNEQAYDGWLNHPSRKESAPRLAQLLKGAADVGPGRIFVVDHAVSKIPSAPIVSGP